MPVSRYTRTRDSVANIAEVLKPLSHRSRSLSRKLKVSGAQGDHGAGLIAEKRGKSRQIRLRLVQSHQCYLRLPFEEHTLSFQHFHKKPRVFPLARFTGPDCISSAFELDRT